MECVKADGRLLAFHLVFVATDWDHSVPDTSLGRCNQLRTLLIYSKRWLAPPADMSNLLTARSEIRPKIVRYSASCIDYH